MGRKHDSRFEKTPQCKPRHHLISSDFPKYNHNPNYFSSQLGIPRMEWILSYEYQRMWIKEREEWSQLIYPETEIVVDRIKAYVANLKTSPPEIKKDEREPFKMKKFKNVPSRTSNRRPPDDKAMQFNKIKKRKLQ